MKVAIDESGHVQAALDTAGVSTETNHIVSLDKSANCLNLSGPVAIEVAPKTPYVYFLRVTNRLEDCHVKNVFVTLRDSDAPIVLDTWWGRWEGDFLTFARACTLSGVSNPEIKEKARKLDAPVFVSMQNDKLFISRLDDCVFRDIAKDKLIQEVARIQSLPGSLRDLVLVRSNLNVPFGQFFEIVQLLHQNGQYHIAMMSEDTSRSADTTPTFQWVRTPTATDADKYYPELARRKGIEGDVILTCRVKADGSLEECKILSEQPDGELFGQAALNMAGLFRMKPVSDDGKSISGATINLPLHFKLPKAASATESSKTQ